ncbi:MAG: signal peptidase I [archaeon]
MRFTDFIKPNIKKIILFMILVIIFSAALRLTLGTYPFWYNVASNAMHPTYSRGDFVFVKATNFGDIEVNNVIIHEIQGVKTPLIMRVVSKDDEKRTFTTKGDNNPIISPSQTNLPESTIKSKVIGRIPYLGYLEILHVGWLLRLILIYIIACVFSVFIFSEQ